MTSAVTENDGKSKGRYWFVLLTGPVGFMLLFLAVYLLNELSCNLGYLLAEVMGLAVSVFVSLLLTAVTLAVIAFAGFLAARIWQRAMKEIDQGATEKKGDNPYFIGLYGILSSALFALLTLAVGVAVVWLRPC